MIRTGLVGIDMRKREKLHLNLEKLNIPSTVNEAITS
jgi:hypothetical protein